MLYILIYRYIIYFINNNYVKLNQSQHLKNKTHLFAVNIRKYILLFIL